MMQTLETLKAKINIAKEELTRKQVEYENTIEQLKELGLEDEEDIENFVKRKREAAEKAEREAYEAIKKLEEEVRRIERAIE